MVDRVVVARGADGGARVGRHVDELDDRVDDVQPLRHAEAAAVRVALGVVRQEVGLHVDHTQRVVGTERVVRRRARAAREAEAHVTSP